MFRSIALVAATLLAVPPAIAGSEFDGSLRALAAAELSVFTTDPAVIDAVRAQNAAFGGMSQAEIDARDQQWRAETAAAAHPMIDEVLSRPGSLRLQELKLSMGGMVTEVFVTTRTGST